MDNKLYIFQVNEFLVTTRNLKYIYNLSTLAKQLYQYVKFIYNITNYVSIIRVISLQFLDFEPINQCMIISFILM